MSKKKNDIDEQVHNVRMLEKLIRNKKAEYVSYRREYIELHEQIVACAFLQKRKISEDEYQQILYPLYKKYMNCYFDYLDLKKKASNYCKMLDWLKTI